MRLRLAAPLLAFLALAGCSGDKAASGDGGGTVIAAMGTDPSGLIPLLVMDETSDAVTDMMFDKLAGISDKLASVGDAGFTPRLAKSWEWSKDSLAITFRIDPAARFHDGTPVKASDVRYTFRLAKDPALGSPVTSVIANIDSVSVGDSLTATFWYRKRSPTQFFEAAYQIAPMPEHVYGKVAPADMKTSDVVKNPVGSGQWRFMRYEPGVRIELVADTANFRGRPKLDRVIFMLGQAPTSAAAAVMAGEMDVAFSFPIDQADRLDSSTVVGPAPYSLNGYGFLAINPYVRKTTTRPHPILGDVNVRRALAMSVDRASMLTNVFRGSGRLAYGPFPTGADLSDSTIGAPAFDTTAAGAMLDAAGWRRGADGVRIKNGQPLALEILTPTSSIIRVRYAELLQEQLNRAGFRISVARAEGPEFSSRQSSGDNDLILLSYVTDASVAGIQQIWSSAGFPPNGLNTLRYRNRAVDATLDSAARNLDVGAMHAQVSRAFRQIMADVPGVWLYSAGTIGAINRRIQIAPLPRDGWWGSLAQWSIPADKRIARDRIGLRPAAATP